MQNRYNTSKYASMVANKIIGIKKPNLHKINQSIFFLPPLCGSLQVCVALHRSLQVWQDSDWLMFSTTANEIIGIKQHNST